MFGPKIKNVFRSRWSAAFWSLSVLLTAYCSVPSPDDGGAGAQDHETEKLLEQFAPRHSNYHHPSPWAKDPGKDRKST